MILDFVGMDENAIGYSVFDIYINYIYSSDYDGEHDSTYSLSAIVFTSSTSDMNYGEVCFENEYDSSKQFCEMETYNNTIADGFISDNHVIIIDFCFNFEEEINNLKLGFTIDQLKEKINVKKYGKYLIYLQKGVIMLVLVLNVASIIVGLAGVFSVIPLYGDYADEKFTYSSWDMDEIDVTVGKTIILWIVELVFTVLPCVGLFWGFNQWSV